jgi:lysine 2,3-aminomutase
MTTLRTATQICDHGFTPSEEHAALESVAARYAIALPFALASLIDRNDPHDPIARQFVPATAELHHQPQELLDPIGDDAHSPVEGIVHRYPDRVLLKLTHVCAVYCRFCFRREMVGPDKPNALPAAALAVALDYIRSHREIWEVILTGGDPLVLSARRLRAVMTSLAAIEHVKVVRIHTRVPIADPARITPDLVRAMKIKGKPTYVAVHVNHARELTANARASCARMADAGIPLLAQSVLLAGVNDTPETLGELMRLLVECRIKPYYLHHGDLASGLCQPAYVLDIPGGHGKSPIGPNYIERTAANGAEHAVIEDFKGRRHRYPPSGC